MRSLERGLALLVAMNRRKFPSVVELARDTRLPRPTVYRLLETLSRAGFVTRSRSLDRYCLARQVRTLSDGFADDDWIADIATPLITQFTRQLIWPVALMTFDEGRMLVRETTHEASPLSIDHGMVGRRLPMLRTAAGRSYLAFCPDNERRAILDMLSHSGAPEDRGARETQRLTKLFDAIRAKGYATQDREINPKTTGIAVPIRLGARVLGSISLIWISSALTIEEAETQLLQPLTSTANRIADAVRDSAARPA
ncbi:MAG: IclR family transcriptional regulator C-terminal domain-containing protein [Xanthobacteraceae bacterium]